jgi:hypothetical protein
VIDELLIRYVEALIYQAVAENMASEQSARMVAMKASDNAGNVIGERSWSTTRPVRLRLPKSSPRSSPVRQRSKLNLKLLKERTWQWQNRSVYRRCGGR